MSETEYSHEPVLLHQSVNHLITNKDGVYADVTFGGGGHSRCILESLTSNGKLYALDQDEAALKNANPDSRLILIKSNFRYLKKYLRYYGDTKIDGILADLGVSSYHFDAYERGFSFHSDAPLDMRMNQDQEITAEDIIMNSSEAELANIFGNYGEVTNAKKIAAQLVKDRKQIRFSRCQFFADWAAPFIYGKRNKYLAQLFQALRIAVNEELQSLQELLEQSLDILKPGGRLVVISYHSLEDRMVKQFLKQGKLEDDPHDMFGKQTKQFKLIVKDAIVPDEQEIKINPRSRSGKMRIGERI